METALDAVHDILTHIDALCVPSGEKSKEFHGNLKDLFDLSVQSFPGVELGPLDELYVTNMDSESIWEQVQSRNRPLNRYIELHVKKLHQAALGRDEGQGKEHKKATKSRVDMKSDDEDSCDDTDEDSDENSDVSDEDSGSELVCNSDDNDSVGSDNESDNDNAISGDDGDDMDDWLDEMDEAEAGRLEVGGYIC